MRNLQLRTLFFLTALVTYATATANDSSLRVELEQTRPYLVFLENNINKAQCYLSEDAFTSCIAAIEGMLSYDRRRLRLIHSSWHTSANTVEVYKHFDSAQVVADQMRVAQDLSDLSSQMSERRQRALAWREVYRKHSGEMIDFDAIRRWIFAYIVDLGKATEYMAEAVNSYLSVTDAHARIVTAKQLRQSGEKSAERYFGIGISLNKVDDAVLVGRVLEDAPASAAGLKTNDVIIAIDGEPVNDKAIREIVDLLRGPTGTQVELKVKRMKQELRFSVERGSVIIKSVYSSVIIDDGQRWGRLRIADFVQPGLCQDVRKALAKLEARKVDGLILDVRNNMGGLIDQAVCIAELFLGPNQVVLTMKKLNHSEQDVVVRTRFKMQSDLPMVTLINAASASASEVLAGALQDTARSFLIGERTFGKGTIQIAERFASIGPVFKFHTVANYYLPSGRTVDRLGLEPDFSVSIHSLSPESTKIVLREADLFPKTGPTTGPQWEQPRPEAIAKLSQCTQDHGLTERPPPYPFALEDVDYPLEYAKQTLSCMHFHQLF